MKKLYKNCKWGHSMSNSHVYGGVRYCKTCRTERYRYQWYRESCKDSNVTDGVTTWNQWAKELWGGPYKREMCEKS